MREESRNMLGMGARQRCEHAFSCGIYRLPVLSVCHLSSFPVISSLSVKACRRVYLVKKSGPGALWCLDKGTAI